LKGLFRYIALLAVVVALAVPSVALGQPGSTCQSYNQQLCSSVNRGGPGDAPSAGDAASTGSTLPFTGLDVALLAAGGGALMGAGFAVRRVARRPN